MVHSVTGWMWGVQAKLWDPLRVCAIPERLRGVFTTRRYKSTFTFTFDNVDFDRCFRIISNTEEPDSLNTFSEHGSER